ncbi:hypothetical protein T440DRAFT_421222 [Plenodomus tracheiphilus IPT5]|uniref:Uncharacterized protein n=1 Tax=Plenodomus tracheiphilus IPT5 TaxID=1408161 RepID=A0A6A7BCZ7_9PLEO|nr:hypothetical protein T440DRAFT_421222 [Plenodomus tracheiphilus IPT5]
MTGTSGNGGIGEGIRNVVGKIHGTGEAIRGKTLAALDDASGDRTTAAKNEAIANKGVDEFQHGYQGHARNAGVTPADTDAERLGTTHSTSTTYGAGAGAGTGSTNVGPHSTNVGNKLDPRYDSDGDHRADPLSSVSGTGTAVGSTNVGTHSTNVGNKLDPRFDSDADHRANPGSAVGGQGYTYPTPLSASCLAQTDGAGDQSQPFHWPQHEHRGSIGGTSGLEAAQKLDPLYEPGQDSMHYSALTNIHRHRGSIGGTSGLHPAEKLDPPEIVRGPGRSQPEPFYHQPVAAHQSRTALGVFEAEDDSSESEETGHRSDTHISPQYNDRFERKDYFPDKAEPNMQIDPDIAARRKSYSAYDPYPPIKRSEYYRKSSEPKYECKRKGSGPCDRTSRKGSETREEPSSRANTHKSDFLNLLDPRVDRRAVRREQAEDMERGA